MNSRYQAWRDIKSFKDLRDKLDMDKVGKLSTSMSHGEISDLLNILVKLDKRANGSIYLKEVRKELLNHEKGMAYLEVLLQADEDNSGNVDIHEFMSAILDANTVMPAHKMKEAFEKFDDDNSGCLDYDEIQVLFASLEFKNLVPKD